ncbi:MAG: hypothetical protein JWN23_1545 [Rhodocyclales bacterium]|nr:hypothetical protein [Rhodocyclales bacterium]
MQQSRIIGVRYIGRAETQEDPLFRTGTIWSAGQIINFSLALAEKLFSKHFDMFEEAPVDYNANTILSVPNALNAQPVVSINLNSMTPAQQRMFARIEFGRTLHENMPDEEVRKTILGMMLDAEETARQSENERFALSFPVNADEYAAIMQGVVELRLVPVAVPAPSEDECSDSETAKTSPTVDDLVAMNADALRALAAEQGIKVHHKAGEEKLRETIATALAQSEVAAPAPEDVVEPAEVAAPSVEPAEAEQPAVPTEVPTAEAAAEVAQP